ncbi:MAG: hypothetical protein WCC53_12630 [Thermoanaerobaculia bacterium]
MVPLINSVGFDLDLFFKDLISLTPDSVDLGPFTLTGRLTFGNY